MNTMIRNNARWGLALLTIVLAVLAVGIFRSSAHRASAMRDAAAVQQDERATYERSVAAESLASQARSDARDRAAAIEAGRLLAIRDARDAAAAKVQAARQAVIDIEDGTRWRNRDAFMPGA